LGPSLAFLGLSLTFGSALGENASGLAGVEMTADRFQLLQGGEVLIAQGSVRAAKDGTVILADRAIAWQKENAIYAEGNVLLTDPGVVTRTDKLLYNWKERRAVARNVELTEIQLGRVQNWHLKAPSIQRRGPYVYEMKDGIATSCGMAKPHQYFSARKVVFREHHSIVLHHPIYRVHEIPVLYLPYYYRDLAHPWPWYHVGFGQSSEFGEFLLTDLGFQIHPGVDLLFDMDYYADRGTGGGINLEYEGERRIGYLDTYFIEDRGEDFDNQPLLQDDRYRIEFLHRELLTDTDVSSLVAARKERLAGRQEHFPGRWTMDVEYQRFSDKNFYKEFFEDEAKTQKEPQNRIFVQGLWDNTAVSILGQTDVNEFIDLAHSEQRTSDGVYGQTEYLPRLRFDLLSEPLWQNRMFLTLGGEYSRVRRLYDGNTRLSAVNALSDDRDLDRLDLRSELSAPFQVDFLHVEPFVFGGETLYEELLEDDNSDWRTAHGAGVRLSTEFWRTFGVTKPKWGIDRLHHVITPEVMFLSAQDTDPEPEELVYCDEVDTEQAEEKITLCLRNVVQTKRPISMVRPLDEILDVVQTERNSGPADPLGGGPLDAARTEQSDNTVNWLEFEVLADFFTAPARDNNGEAWSNIKTDLRWRPHYKLSLFNDNEINTDPGQFEVINAGITYRPAAGWALSPSHRYDRESGNRSILNVRAQFNEKWGMIFWSDYEWDEDEFYNVRIILQRTFHCWVFEIGYEIDREDVAGREDEESTIFFFISPRMGSALTRLAGHSSGSFMGDSTAY